MTPTTSATAISHGNKMRSIEWRARYTPRGVWVVACCLAWGLSLDSASGAVFRFQYQADGVTASGLLRTSDLPDPTGAVQILGISGMRNGVAISALWPTGQAIPLNDGYPVDNLLLVRPPHLSLHGFGYALADGSYANPFFASFTQPPSAAEFWSNPQQPAGLQTREGPIALTITTVPEPTAWQLLAALAAGLGLPGMQAWRKQRRRWPSTR